MRLPSWSMPTGPATHLTAARRGFCEKYCSAPQYGFGGGQIETVKLVTSQPGPGPFSATGMAVRGSSAGEAGRELAALVRVEREMSPIGRACVAPCCKDH
jgi:hypothetical protein